MATKIYKIFEKKIFFIFFFKNCHETFLVGGKLPVPPFQDNSTLPQNAYTGTNCNKFCMVLTRNFSHGNKNIKKKIFFYFFFLKLP